MDATTFSVEFKVFDEQIKAEIPLSAEPIRSIELLPILQQLSDSFVEFSIKKINQDGKSITCKSGCAACCRQLVRITESESYLLYELIETMPKKRRNAIWQRFDDAIEILEELGLIEPLEDINDMSSEENQDLDEKYFNLKIPCPFLEKETCSIYHNRPLACREYLVTSSADNCSNPFQETIERVPLAGGISVVAAQIDEPLHSGYVRYVPLILAPILAEESPDESQVRIASEMLTVMFERLRTTAI
ncbi:MAG: YkgJ family cysteine cluster protein [Ignavibacteriae bacterium]|nr:YkgJ family cysteine cluster protein [Ignavibacteriota bacterium]